MCVRVPKEPASPFFSYVAQNLGGGENSVVDFSELCWKMTESWCWKMTVSWCWKMTGIPVSEGLKPPTS
mgnify:CR=1 FL=1